ncbi:MAG: DPP IV N-terminal domain-containing protein [Bacteroidales bacterium]|nr:DPP IV N-terminal domain-containing protein [Bacteroidales bacterium]
MKRIGYALLALLIAFPAVSTAREKIRLTEEQQLKGLPESVVKRTAVPVTFLSSDKAVYVQGSKYYQYDFKSGSSTPYDYKAPKRVEEFPNPVKGWKNPTYSPDGTKIAYTLDNDLYSMDVATGEVVRHTFDGSQLILNGYASWVYYEEILGRASRYKAFWWSPDSKVIAFYRFDNTRVPMFPIYHSPGLHGYLDQTRYPKAGDENPKVRIGFVSARGGETVWADFDENKDQYFGIPFWSGDGKRFMVSWMPRSQDDLELFSVEPATGTKLSVYKEHQNCWIEWMEEMLFTPEGIYIVRDYTGWQQIYYLTYDGKRYEQLTEGRNWSVNLLKVDSKYLWFTAKRESSARVDIYRVTLKNKKLDRLSYGNLNFSNVTLSPDGNNLLAIASNTRTPNQLVAISLPSGNIGRKKVEVIFDCRGEQFDDYLFGRAEVVNIPMRDGEVLPALVTWPVDYNRFYTGHYPVLVSIYGGPDSPRVKDSWGTGGNQWWAYHDVIQVVLDNRVSGHLGKKGLEAAYRKLATVEVQDFIDGLKYFLKIDAVNKEKTGVYGFSFGGTMTTLLVTEGCDYFKYGIAGGGVYDWALYDTHYTERYVDTPQVNPDGYASTRVMERVAKSGYKGDKTNMLRITHGTADDNVHFQNTLQLIDMMERKCMDFELSIYPEEYHGYRGLKSRHSTMQDYKFWYRYLLEKDLPETLVKEFSK